MDADTAAAWQSASNSVQNAAGVIATGNLNYRTRVWNEAMLDKQRAWAIQDRDYANEYNSPTAVMARAKAAGINPYLVASNGQTTTASSPVRSADVQAWHPQAPDFKADNGPMAVLNAELLQAQIQNVKSQNANINADTAMKEANTSNLGMRTTNMEYDLQVKRMLQETKIGQEVARLAGLQEDIDVKKQTAFNLWEAGNQKSYQVQFLHNENERREAMTAANVAQAVERVLLMRKQELLVGAQTQKAMTSADLDKTRQTNVWMERDKIDQQIQNLQKDGQIKDLIIQMDRLKIDPTTQIGMKVIDGILGVLSKGAGSTVTPEKFKRY